MPKKIGIVREWKTDCERRAPVTPGDVARLTENANLSFLVEPSPYRIFEDVEYEKAGAELSTDLSGCDFVIGIKEIPIDNLQPGKPHLFFSHTIKGQEYNMPLLRRMLELNCTLLDFELVRNEEGHRLIFFGRQAGQAGMLNTLWAFGQRLLAQGIATPFADLEQARFYSGYEEGLERLRSIGEKLKKDGIPRCLRPFVCGITGTGNVSTGAKEVLSVLDPIVLTPEELEAGKASDSPDRVHLVVFGEQHLCRRKDGSPFSIPEYRSQPELYEAALPDYLDSLDILLTGHFWDVRYPRVVTKQKIKELHDDCSTPKLTVIGDVSCDPEGGVEVTLKATYPDNPCYVYHPQTGTVTDGFEGEGLTIMAVEILPTELALDSSQVFSHALCEFLPCVLDADFSKDFDSLELPIPFKLAVIAHQGRLAPDWAHLLG